MPSLAKQKIVNQSELPSVCIVTGEFIGPLNCGGIGTAMTGLAETLAAHGHKVTVLYTRGMWLPFGRGKKMRDKYADKEIAFEWLHPADFRTIAGPMADMTFAVPSATFNWLRNNKHDIVHFNDTDADGFLCIAAKKVGLAFVDSHLTTALHSPRKWVYELGNEVNCRPVSQVMDAAERYCISNADSLWSPSGYLLNWLDEKGFCKPKKTFIKQYVMPNMPQIAGLKSSSKLQSDQEKLKRLIFFGRLEERKGLLIFLDAMDLLSNQLLYHEIEVVFLGSNTHIRGLGTRKLIEKRAVNWAFKWKQLSNLGQPEALRYLALSGQLAVIASNADNSPCTVYECIAANVPFIACNTGGIPEIIRSDDHPTTLFEHSTEALVSRIEQCLDMLPHRPRFARSNEDRAKQWLDSHRRTGDLAPSASLADVAGISTKQPGVAVVIEDFGDTKRLRETLKSLQGAPSIRCRIAVLRSAGLAQPLDASYESISQRALADWIARLDGETPHCLFVRAGLLIDGDAVAKMAACALAQSVTALVPSVTCKSMGQARRIDAIGVSSVAALVSGAAWTGTAWIDTAVLQRAIRSKSIFSQPHLGPFDGILDQLAACGLPKQNERKNSILFHPYPESIASADIGLFADIRTSTTPQRLALYTQRGGGETNAAIAAMAIGRGWKRDWRDRRAMMFKFASSPLGPVLPLALSLLGKLGPK